MIRTFFDSGVLIAAARLLDPDGERALKFLDDPNRVFLTSPFVHLAAAHLSHADEFITTEKPNKAIYRSKLVKVVYLFS